MIILNKIHNNDCIKGMEQLEEESVDLIIADPPYNLNKNFGSSSTRWNQLEEWLNWSKEWINISLSKLKPSGSIFIYGIHHYLCYIQVHLYEMDMKYRRQFIWHYENGFSTYQKTPAATYEPLLWFSKSDDFTYHKIRVPYKSQKRLKNKITKNGKVWQPNPEGKHGGDVWRFPVLAGKRFAKEKVAHPTQKPLNLCDRIVKHFSNEGDIILVPFAGSGSECISAFQNNRNFIAFELNQEYIKIANNRLLEASNLFQQIDLSTQTPLSNT